MERRYVIDRECVVDLLTYLEREYDAHWYSGDRACSPDLIDAYFTSNNYDDYFGFVFDDDGLGYEHLGKVLDGDQKSRYETTIRLLYEKRVVLPKVDELLTIL